MPNKKREELQNIIQPLISSHTKEFRIKHGLSQEKLARKIKLNLRSYHSLEHGECVTSLKTFLLLISTMEEDEYQSFIENLLAAIKD